MIAVNELNISNIIYVLTYMLTVNNSVNSNIWMRSLSW